MTRNPANWRLDDPLAEPGQITVAGDWHRNGGWGAHVLEQAADAGGPLPRLAAEAALAGWLKLAALSSEARRRRLSLSKGLGQAAWTCEAGTARAG